MKTIYIDSEFKCHIELVDAIATLKTDFFDDKCKEFIEGYRFVPDGQMWTREDGVVFTGEMIVPWKPYDELDAAQREYERSLAEAALVLLGQ